MKTLFANCLILVREKDGYKTLKNAYLGIDNDTIIYVSNEKPNDKYDVIKDYSNKLIMSGLVNAHGHSPMTILRGVGSGLKLQDWLFNAIFPIEDKMIPQDVERGARLGALEMIRGGTTCYSEMYDFPWCSALVAAESGLKCNFCRCGLCFDPNVEMKDLPRYHEMVNNAETYLGYDIYNAELEKELGVNKLPQVIKDAFAEGRVKYDISCHSEYLTSEKFVKAMAEARNKYGLQVQVHMSETKKEVEECKQRHDGLTPTQYFEKCGLLNNCYAAHCVHVTDEDLDILKRTNTTIVHNPSSNMKLGSGFAPIIKALEKGVNVAIGTDGCASNNNLDMFEEMHLAALLQAGLHMDSAIINAETILDMATINGAKALGRNDTGILNVGYKADIIAIDLDKPHLYPCLDVPSLIVYSMHSSDVYMTMVNGKTLYEDGKFYTLDYQKTITEALEAVKRLGL